MISALNILHHTYILEIKFLNLLCNSYNIILMTEALFCWILRRNNLKLFSTLDIFSFLIFHLLFFNFLFQPYVQHAQYWLRETQPISGSVLDIHKAKLFLELIYTKTSILIVYISILMLQCNCPHSKIDWIL